jgi:corrinoid protein of di/trimethylamine methyltransferase
VADMNPYEELKSAIIKGDVEGACGFAKKALDANHDPLDVIDQGVIPATDQLGDLFGKFEIFLPELILGGAAAKAAMDILVAQIPVDTWSQSRPGTVVLGTVQGDLHDIGKNMVGAMLAASGFEVVDLGVNVPSKDFIKKAEEVGAKIIAISSLMSTSLYFQKDVIEYLRDSGKRGDYYVIVGGGPVTPEWATEIGADGTGKQANDAVQICKKLMSEKPEAPLSDPLIIW